VCTGEDLMALQERDEQEQQQDKETKDERLDREMIELLNGLRVIIPGVQVLLAFLLTAPFNQRFQSLNGQEEGAYFVSLLSTAAATAFLIAPSTYHRILFRARDKEHLLRVGNILTLVGTLFLATGVITAVALVTSFLYDGRMTATVTAVAVALFALLWYGLPLMRRLRATDQV
jgi:hypothetical protein